MAQGENSDYFTRPKGSKRLLATIPFRLTRDQVRCAFIWSAMHMGEGHYFATTPYVESLSRILYAALAMHGDEVVMPTTTYNGREPTTEILDYAERCTQRFWNSTRIKE